MVYRVVAFIGRYGHQPANDVMLWSRGRRVTYFKALVDLLDEEKQSGGGLTGPGG